MNPYVTPERIARRKAQYKLAWAVFRMVLNLGLVILLCMVLRDKWTEKPDACIEERKIAFNDGYTKGFSDSVDMWRRQHPQDFGITKSN